MTEQTHDEKIERIRQWLRFHTDKSVEIHLWELYGTMSIKVREWPDGDIFFQDIGMTLGKRLDSVIKALEIK